MATLNDFNPIWELHCVQCTMNSQLYTGHFGTHETSNMLFKLTRHNTACILPNSEIARLPKKAHG